MWLPDDLIEAVKPFAERDGKTVATWIRDLAREATTFDQVNYEGPDPTVECAWTPCRNRLRRSHWNHNGEGNQWCSPEHRALTEAEEAGP